MTMSPSTCSQALRGYISLHAVIFMLRKVESTSDANRGPEPCQSGTALNSPFQFALPTLELSPVRAYAHAHDDHYLTIDGCCKHTATRKWRPAVLSLSILRVYCTTSAHDSGSSCSVVYVRKHEDAAMIRRNVVSRNCLWTEGDGAL